MKDDNSNKKNKTKVRSPYSVHGRWIYMVLGLGLLTAALVGVTAVVLTRFFGENFNKIGWTPLIAQLVLLGVAIVLFAVVMVVGSRGFLAPIHRMSQAMEKVSKGDLSVRVKGAKDSTEMGELIARFNAMVEELGTIETLRNDFIANVSHEFKTPLTTIQGYSMLLQSDDLSDEERKQYTEAVLTATKQLTNLTTNILKMSKIENQKDIDYQEFALAEQIRQSILILEPIWSAKNIDWDIDLVEVSIVACEELLATVWSNLLGNAIKFSNDGGVIAVKLTKQKEYVTVEVSDHGVGMSEETLRHIYDKFYQGDGSRAGEGNGLGLALVKRIVELHRGQIVATSQEGEGSTFVVTIPIVPQE